MKSIIFKYAVVLTVFLTGVIGCKKTEITIPPLQGHFTDTTGSYLVKDDPNTEYKIPVGLTTTVNTETSVTISVSSPSNAQSGIQYTILNPTVIIPAGKALDYIKVKGIYSGFPLGANRRDTLIFTISSGRTGDFNQRYTLIMQGACDVKLNNLLGAYPNTNEVFGTTPYGPYITTISAVQSISATSGTITVDNIWDYGWNPITFTLDWSNGNKITLVEQSGIGDAATFNPPYPGQDVSVRPFAGSNGTFDYCNSKLTLKMQLGVTGLGWFPSLYTVTMQR